MPDENDEETGPTASIEEQLSTVRAMVDLLGQPDGREKARRVLYDHWNKLREAERRRTN